MLGGGQQLFNDTIRGVKAWSPSKEYDHERKFQSELQEWLDQNLNSGGDGMMGGGNQQIPVETEHGKSKADIAVDDIIGIEMKRDLSNSQTKKLRGQIESYLDNYQYVIVCACGVKDTSAWRKIQKQYEGGSMDIQIDAGAKPEFIWKKKQNYGQDPNRQDKGGNMMGGGLGL